MEQRPCEDRTRSWAVLPPAKECQEPLEAETGNRDPHRRAISGHYPADTLMMVFHPPELLKRERGKKKKVLLF